MELRIRLLLLIAIEVGARGQAGRVGETVITTSNRGDPEVESWRMSQPVNQAEWLEPGGAAPFFHFSSTQRVAITTLWKSVVIRW